MTNHLETIFRIARFGIVGVAATLIHMGVAFLLSSHTELPLILVNILAFLVAFVMSFCGHYYWTFQTSAPRGQSLLRFFIVALSGLAASTVVLSALMLMNVGGDYIKLAISILIIPAITYCVGKSWAFADTQKI